LGLHEEIVGGAGGNCGGAENKIQRKNMHSLVLFWRVSSGK